MYILVVLYKKSVKESETIQGIISSADFLKNINATVHIWDNSPETSLNAETSNFFEGLFSFKYTHCPENKPLSFIYNEAINFVKKREGLSHLVLLDHDSAISSAYFEELHTIIQSKQPADIILPQARFENLIISPARLFLVKGIYFKNIKAGLYNKKLLAINSGMAISKQFLDRTGFLYHPSLLSYGTDNYLLNFANRHRAVYYIMQFSFIHGYSFYEVRENAKRAEIFWQIKKANKLAFSFSIIQSFSIGLYNLAASVKNALKYKSIKYLIRK